jgi:WD40 repeat protein
VGRALLPQIPEFLTASIMPNADHVRATVQLAVMPAAPDSERLASGSGSVMTPAADNSIRVWDIASQTEFANSAVHRREVVDCAWFRDGGRIISASKDGTVVLRGHEGDESYTAGGHRAIEAA